MLCGGRLAALAEEVEQAADQVERMALYAGDTGGLCDRDDEHSQGWTPSESAAFMVGESTWI